MAAQAQTQTQNQSQNDELPYVLILKAIPPAFRFFGDHFFDSPKFRFLKAYESPLPLPQFLQTHAQSVQAILSSGGAPVTADIIRLLPHLRLVVTTSQGLNHIDLSECRLRGIAVAGAGTIFSVDCADAVVALLIDVFRKISAANRFVKQGLWSSKPEYPLGTKLGGKRFGIVGLGNIGTQVAKRLEAFGCTISYNSRKKKPFVSYIFYPHVVELAANCDVLIICCALTDETHHLIDKKVLMALGKNGVIVNIARGAIIDEKELVRCLVEGEIRGAGLDVFENEPNVPEELFGLDNVVMSPHNAVFSKESFDDLRELVVGNLEAFFSNQPSLTPVSMDDLRFTVNNCPNLSSLSLRGFKPHTISRPLGCPCNHLREVITGAHGYRREIDIAVYLLNNAMVLEKMVIDPQTRSYDGNGRWEVTEASSSSTSAMSRQTFFQHLRVLPALIMSPFPDHFSMQQSCRVRVLILASLYSVTVYMWNYQSQSKEDNYILSRTRRRETDYGFFETPVVALALSVLKCGCGMNEGGQEKGLTAGHSGYGKRKGTREEKVTKVKGNVFKNNRVLMESFNKSKAEKEREKTLSDQFEAKHAKHKASRPEGRNALLRAEHQETGEAYQDSLLFSCMQNGGGQEKGLTL
ncbi:hypothetical protein CCACVL1_01167 [Corchorus capsularis]|uniref:D-isomer specific 2-hydroxyacid dehydrogenase, NAD-binding protein n=1 Tax=Corchorus capsularis TaxID=210143 RepID=A0A1R3KM45_COCAP|nr:hypothetical protein CCACVL1_01167 [Corchorus capsularis]